MTSAPHRVHLLAGVACPAGEFTDHAHGLARPGPTPREAIAAREWSSAAGTFTDAGRAVREQVEAVTDELAAPGFRPRQDAPRSPA